MAGWKQEGCPVPVLVSWPPKQETPSAAYDLDGATTRPHPEDNWSRLHVWTAEDRETGATQGNSAAPEQHQLYSANREDGTPTSRDTGGREGGQLDAGGNVAFLGRRSCVKENPASSQAARAEGPLQIRVTEVAPPQERILPLGRGVQIVPLGVRCQCEQVSHSAIGHLLSLVSKNQNPPVVSMLPLATKEHCEHQYRSILQTPSGVQDVNAGCCCSHNVVTHPTGAVPLLPPANLGYYEHNSTTVHRTERTSRYHCEPNPTGGERVVHEANGQLFLSLGSGLQDARGRRRAVVQASREADRLRLETAGHIPQARRGHDPATVRLMGVGGPSGQEHNSTLLHQERSLLLGPGICYEQNPHVVDSTLMHEDTRGVCMVALNTTGYSQVQQYIQNDHRLSMTTGGQPPCIGRQQPPAMAQNDSAEGRRPSWRQGDSQHHTPAYNSGRWVPIQPAVSADNHAQVAQSTDRLRQLLMVRKRNYVERNPPLTRQTAGKRPAVSLDEGGHGVQYIPVAQQATRQTPGAFLDEGGHGVQRTSMAQQATRQSPAVSLVEGGHCVQRTSKAQQATRQSPAVFLDEGGHYVQYLPIAKKATRQSPAVSLEEGGNCVQRTSMAQKATRQSPAVSLEEGGNCVQRTSMAQKATRQGPAVFLEEGANCVQYLPISKKATRKGPAVSLKKGGHGVQRTSMTQQATRQTPAVSLDEGGHCVQRTSRAQQATRQGPAVFLDEGGNCVQRTSMIQQATRKGPVQSLNEGSHCKQRTSMTQQATRQGPAVSLDEGGHCVQRTSMIQQATRKGRTTSLDEDNNCDENSLNLKPITIKTHAQCPDKRARCKQFVQQQSSAQVSDTRGLASSVQSLGTNVSGEQNLTVEDSASDNDLREQTATVTQGHVRATVVVLSDKTSTRRGDGANSSTDEVVVYLDKGEDVATMVKEDTAEGSKDKQGESFSASIRDIEIIEIDITSDEDQSDDRQHFVSEPEEGDDDDDESKVEPVVVSLSGDESEEGVSTEASTNVVTSEGGRSPDHEGDASGNHPVIDISEDTTEIEKSLTVERLPQNKTLRADAYIVVRVDVVSSEEEEEDAKQLQMAPDLEPKLVQYTQNGKRVRNVYDLEERLSIELTQRKKRSAAPLGSYVEAEEADWSPKGNQYECKVCKTTFRTRYLLTRHKKPPHDGKKRFECSVCCRAYCFRRNLEKHLDVHTGTRYLCGDCGKEFPHRYNLLCHRESHTGERPYHCDGCGDDFPSNDTLVRHRAQTGELPYRCCACAQTFRWRSLLRLHARLHERPAAHRCPVCARAFHWSGQLLAHQQAELHFQPGSSQERRASKERPSARCAQCGQSHAGAHGKFWCGVCRARYCTFKGVQLHKRDAHPETHCRFCRRYFMNTVSLQRHVLRHHHKYALFKCKTCERIVKRDDLRRHMHGEPNQDFIVFKKKKTVTTTTTFTCADNV